MKKDVSFDASFFVIIKYEDVILSGYSSMYVYMFIRDLNGIYIS